MLKILQDEFKKKIDNYISNNQIIIKYIGEYLLPDNLKVILEKQEKNNEIVPLNKYFNKEIYENDIKSMYDVLNNWMIYKILVSKKEGNIEKLENLYEVNPTAINIFIQFVSKVSPYYIDCLLILLYSLVSNTTINNRGTFLNNDYFYKWLFEIIYFFNNKENEVLVDEKERTNIELIKSHSIELFKQYITFKNPFKAQMIVYLMDYSCYLREKYIKNEKQIKEITNITRVLLTIITDTLSSEAPLVVDVITKNCFEFMLLYKNNNIILDDNKIIINKNENGKTNKKYSGDNLYESKDNKNEFKILDNNKSVKNNENDENDNNINIENIDNKKDEHNKSFDDKNNNINNSMDSDAINSLINLILIPDMLMNNIYLKEKSEQNEIKNEIKAQTQESDNNILNEMWEDFNLYNFIFDYYHGNLWGLEAMCGHININYDKEEVVEIFKDLLKKYTDSKHKNVLVKMLNRYLNYDEYNMETEKKAEKVNILNFILILLCVAYDTTLDKDERILIEKQIEQFLIFCVLCSLNISSSEKTFNTIQNRLHDLIGFGLIFFQKRDEGKYNQFFEKIIKPIFEGTITEISKKGFKGIFTLPKKTLYKHTAIDRLFIIQEIDSEENIKDTLKDDSAKRYASEMVPNNLNINDDSAENDSDKKSKKNKKKEKKDKKDKKNKETKFKIVFRGDGDVIVKHIINDTVNTLKNERYKKLNNAFEYIKEYYINSNNKAENDETKLIEEEKRRINLKILNIVPDLENNIRKYSSTSLVQEKKRRKNWISFMDLWNT